MLRPNSNQREFVQTKVGPYPVDRMPSNWQRHAGALKRYSKEIEGFIQDLKNESEGN
jgi:hypothetical protein